MPQGRIVLKSICQSKKLSQLKTDGARLLYTWLLPNVDINGCFSGDEYVINGQILSRLKKTIPTITGYLQDLHDKELIIWYEADNDKFLCIPDFATKQPSLNPSKEAKSTIPMPSPELLQTYSGLTPPKAKESEANESEGKGRKSEVKDGSSFSSTDRSSVVSDESKFHLRSIDLFGCAKNGDKTTLKRIAEHLSKSLDEEVFDKAWRVAQECKKKGSNPIALFISRMKDEFNYRK
jgi:hypothetical protein